MRKAGFAMPLVLGMVAILSLTLATAILSLRGLNEQTRLAKAGAEFEQTAMTAEARLAYLMVTEPFGAASIDVGSSRRSGQGQAQTPPTARLFLDARPYMYRLNADGPAYLAQVQDEAGLINLYQMDQLQLQRLFEWAGLSADDAETLAGELVAYNADPTTHQPMRRPVEIFRLAAAAQLITDRVWRRLESRMVAYPDTRAANINTAPAEVLKIWFDLSDDQAQEIVDNRDDDQPLTSTAQIGVATGVNQNFALTGGRLRFHLTDPVSGLSYQSSLVFTWNNGTRPVWVENVQVTRPRSPPVLPEEAEDFPPIPDIAS